jgi:hypothetical protein
MVVTRGKDGTPCRGGDASLVVCEVSPEDGCYRDLHASCDVAAESLVAGERVVELLARDAVGDGCDDVECALGVLADEQRA